jgi:hypothetical protein
MADRVNESFVNAANALTQLLRDSQSAADTAYERGRAEAYMEVLSWLQQAEHGDMKHVTFTSLLQHLQKHLPEVKICHPFARKRHREMDFELEN